MRAETWDDLTPEEVDADAWYRQRYDQGFPLKVEDPLAIDAVATLIIEHDRSVAAKKTSSAQTAA
jgi:hypothetical protein